MNTDILSLAGRLSNQELLAQVKLLVHREREATAALIAHLAVLDERGLYLVEGCSSMFTYCMQVLHLSEHAAYGRIEAAGAARRYPVILELLGDGSVNLTTVGLLAPHLTPENHGDLLEAAKHKSKRHVEELVARLRPQPSVPSSVRRLPAPRSQPVDDAPILEFGSLESRASLPPAPAPLPARRAVIAPLAPERYKVQFTASAETYAKLLRAQELLRHQIPDGDVGEIMDRARDGGQCAFVAHSGRRCTARAFLEFHHVVPHSVGGKATVENIQLRCRGHNGYEAERLFGRRKHSGAKHAGGDNGINSVRTELKLGGSAILISCVPGPPQQ